MDYEIYDRLQASLGGISVSFMSDCQEVLKHSDADESVKRLISEICVKNKNAYVELCQSISDALIAASR